MSTEPDFWLDPGYREHLWENYRRGTSSPVRPDDWLYPLRGNRSDFLSGIRGDGEQVLLGHYHPDLVACFFGPAGDLLRVEKRPTDSAPDDDDPERRRKSLDVLKRAGQEKTDQDFALALEAVLWGDAAYRKVVRWMRELGIEPGVVRIRRFHLAEKRIGIEDGNRLEEDGIFDDEESGGWEQWLHSGTFVFWWSRDLWVDENGTVFAT